MGLRRGKKSKKQESPLPAPGLPMPNGELPPLPMPPGAASLPPLPAANLPAPAPLPAAPTPDLPAAPLPMPLPAAPLPEPIQTPATNDPNMTLSGIAEEKGYNELWAKRSDKPLPQIYGHIDRIANKEAGSLLDRYADRFGHSLDREIIVMRKAELDDKVAELRDAPVVELIDDAIDEPQGPESELKKIEDELRSLKPLYKEAKSIGDTETLAELTPTLQALMAQRKALKSSLEGVQETTTVAASSSDNDDAFVQFVAIVDDLLGDHLPEEIVNAFVESADFEVYKEVLADPGTTDDETRTIFYNMVDDQLGNMPEASINAFTETSDFAIYLAISEKYKEA